MGHSPKEMVLIGVQPGSIEMEVGLTEEVEAQLDTLVSNVLTELAKWEIEASVVKPGSFSSPEHSRHRTVCTSQYPSVIEE